MAASVVCFTFTLLLSSRLCVGFLFALESGGSCGGFRGELAERDFAGEATLRGSWA